MPLIRYATGWLSGPGLGLVLAAVLAACSPPQPSGYRIPPAGGADADAEVPGNPGSGASIATSGTIVPPLPRRFVDDGAAHSDESTLGEWLRHAWSLTFSQFPQADRLPRHHVETPWRAATQFVNARDAELAITWYGHASFLLRLGDTKILTDPVFAKRLGPGTDRLVPVLPDPQLLRWLDAIVISHADMDHFDMDTLRGLSARFPNASIHVPRGTAGLAQRAGFARVFEHARYGRVTLGDVSLTAVPAIHGLRRPPYRSDSMDWVGFMIESPDTRIYFAGDTGMGDIFEPMRRHFGPVDIALMPAGAWAPRAFQKAHHVTPEEALEISRILDASLSIGMHWGTYPLSPEPPTEQKRRFLAAGTAQNPSTVMRIGETRVFDARRIAMPGS